MQKLEHTPVMLNEVIEFLEPKKGGCFIDCTLGAGGYSLALSKIVGNSGFILGIDPDKNAIDYVVNIIKEKKIKNIKLANDNYKEIDKIFEENREDCQASLCDGIVFDLGLSQDQLKDGTRGFSFLVDAPLNMAFGPSVTNENTTWRLINRRKETELVKIFFEYGEERFARRIAKGIIEARKLNAINTTQELVNIIKKSVPQGYINGKGIHYATRTFQALRIATNDELENIKIVLPKAINLLKKGGRIAVVSFHSLEDRIIKQYFKLENKDCVCPKEVPICGCQQKQKLKIINKKVIKPSELELARNPKARSAKLRVAEKI